MISGPTRKLSKEYGVCTLRASGPKTISRTLAMMSAIATSKMNWLCSGRVMNGLMIPACIA